MRNPAVVQRLDHGGAAAAKGIEHHIADKREQLYAAARQLAGERCLMAYALAALAIEFPDAQHPLLKLIARYVAPPLPQPLPLILVQNYDNLHRGYDMGGAGRLPAAPCRAPRYVALVPQNGGVILPARLHGYGGDVRRQRLLAILVLVYGHIDAESAGRPAPVVAVGQPLAGELQVLPIRQAVIVSPAAVFHADIVRRRCDDQVRAVFAHGVPDGGIALHQQGGPIHPAGGIHGQTLQLLHGTAMGTIPAPPLVCANGQVFHATSPTLRLMRV